MSYEIIHERSVWSSQEYKVPRRISDESRKGSDHGEEGRLVMSPINNNHEDNNDLEEEEAEEGSPPTHPRSEKLKGENEKPKNPLISPTELCKVCREPAAKHNHYGSVTCFSCRAFFRRSIQNKTASSYVCRREQNCDVTLKCRKNCQFCRYKRCLEAGMKPTWVLSEEERYRRFKKNRLKLQMKRATEARVAQQTPSSSTATATVTTGSTTKVESSREKSGATAVSVSSVTSFARYDPLTSSSSKDDFSLVPLSSYETSSSSGGEEDDLYHRLPSEPFPRMSDDEFVQIQMLSQIHDSNYKSINFGEELIKEMVMSSMFGIPLSIKASMTGYRLMIQRATKIAQGTEEFVRLPLNVQAILLRENADLMVSLRAAIFFDSKRRGIDQILISMGVEDHETAKNVLLPVLNQTVQLRHINYKMFNTIQEMNPETEVETRYNILLNSVGTAISSDSTIAKILTFIIIFSPDFTTMTDESFAKSATDVERRKLEKIQEMYINMLRRYLLAQNPQRKVAISKFANVLQCIASLRELTWIKKQRMLIASVDR